MLPRATLATGYGHQSRAAFFHTSRPHATLSQKPLRHHLFNTHALTSLPQATSFTRNFFTHNSFTHNSLTHNSLTHNSLSHNIATHLLRLVLSKCDVERTGRAKTLSLHLSGKRVGNSRGGRPSSSYPRGNRLTDGSLEAKLPTIWTDEKQSRAEAERRERLEERRSEKRKSQKKEDADARKGRKAAKHFVFPKICRSGKRRVRSQLAR